MRFSSLISLGFLGVLGGCGDADYRLGSSRTDDPSESSGGTDWGRGGAGAVESGGRAGANTNGFGGASAAGGSGGAGSTGAASGEGGTGGGGSPSAGGVGGAGGIGAAAGAGGANGAGGTGAEPLTRDVVSIVTNVGGPRYLDADEQYVYFCSTNEEAVWRIDHFGLGLEKLAEGRCSWLEADGAHVYWIAELDIRRVAKTGGTPEVVAVVKSERDYSQYAGAWLAFDDTHVYMSTYWHQPVDSRVLRAPKAGGDAEVAGHVPEAGSVTGVAVSRNWLYWGDSAWGGDVHRTDLTTGATEAVNSARVTTLRVIGDSLWFATLGENSNDQGLLGWVPLNGGPTKFSTRVSSDFFDGDGVHVYWIDSQPSETAALSSHDLLRINAATGAEELVASVRSGYNGGVAVTREWVFVNNPSPNEAGGIFRLGKPQP